MITNLGRNGTKKMTIQIRETCSEGVSEYCRTEIILKVHKTCE